MTILHATSDPDFITQLRRVLNDANGQPHSVDIAVGYFYLSGFNEVAEQLASRPGKVRILIGRTDRPTMQEIAAGYSPREAAAPYHAAQNRGQEANALGETLNNIGRNLSLQPQNDAVETGVKSLAALVSGGKIEIRAYLKERMHAKTYIGYNTAQGGAGTAIIGSTNFSAAGFTGNTELNYPVRHDGDIVEIRQWFERLWQDGEPVNERVIDQLNNGWVFARPDPYLIYLKILYELYGDTIGDSEPLLIAPPVELADFQQDAVAAGLAMLNRHNGCYIADVVGLGKTYIGAEILRQLALREPESGDPLVICPASLTAMWERVCDQFRLENADVISMGRLTAASYNADRALRKTLRQAGPVLIDEAHNFRNNNQRRRTLLDFLKGAKRHKTILLSATPQNLAPRDILRQLELFLNLADHGLPGIAGHLSQYFPADTETPADETTGEVLRHILLRRRRRDIVRYYPNSALAGQPIRFPETKLVNQQYSLDHAYQRAGGLQKIVDLLKIHQASRYRYWHYLTSEAKAKDQYRQLQNPTTSLPSLIRVLLFKRLESSIPAFRSTLETLIKSNRDFRNSLLQGQVSRDDGGDDADDSADDLEINDPNQDRVFIKGETYDAHDFRTGEWLNDLDVDYDALQKIYDSIKNLNAADDAKLHAVKGFVTSPGANTEKVLIFTESKVTAQYLYEELSQVYKGGIVDILTGDDGKRQSLDKMSRFSPKSNGKPNLPAAQQIRILIATDVLSEGQNLQDCGRVLNYDLHWNPVKLIQRYGRVDRITTAHETIHLHNMLPDAGVDRQIGLTGQLSARAQSFHNLIGLDDAILQQTERVNRESIYAIYDGEMPEQDETLSDLVLAQEAAAALNQVRRERPEVWEKLLNMPDGLRAAHTASGGSDATYALICAADVKQGYRIDAELIPHPLSPAELVRATECEPNTPAAVLPPGINSRVSAAVTAFQSRQERANSRQEPQERSTANIRYIEREMGQLRLGQRAPADLLRTEQLRAAFTGDLPASINNRITKLRRERVTGVALRDALTELQARLPTPPSHNAAPIFADELRIACSMSTLTGSGL